MFINYYAILLSVVIIILKRYSDKICQFVQLVIQKRETPEVTKLKNELKQLKSERDSINMMDEFARYALVDRKINKLNDDLQQQMSQTRSIRLKHLMYIRGTLFFLIGILSFSLIWFNLDKPIVDFSNFSQLDNTDLNIFYPFNYFLAFPCTHRLNSIGVTFWLFILNKTLDITFNKLNNNNKAISSETEKLN